jgi:toxin ParE1/3/4
MQPEYSRRALIDLDEIAETIRKDRPRSAVRFLNAVERTMQRLLDQPESASLFESDNPELEGLRVCLIRGFKKYLLFFRIHENSIYVERVLHGARNIEELL